MSHKNVNFEYIILFLIGTSFWNREKLFQVDSGINAVDRKDVDMILFNEFAYSCSLCMFA